MPLVTHKDPTIHLNTYTQVHYDLPSQPRQVRIEVSSFCNSSCPWCHFHGDFKPQTREKGKMTPATFQLLIDDIASWPQPLFEISPTNFGETFLHRDWYWMLQYISSNLPKTKIIIVTTGSLMTDDVLDRLASIPTLSYCNFSINAYFSESWARIHGQPAKNMLRAVNAVHKLRDRRPDIKVNVSMVYDPLLVTELEKDMFINYWEPLGPTTISHVSFANHPTRKPVVPVTLPCRSVFDGLVIFDGGAVSNNCCFNGDNDKELEVGHFPEEKLLDIWNGEKMKRICEIHNSGKRAEIEICKNCTFA